MAPVTCIYKVPGSMREVKPEAYRPRMVIIGLHNRSAKPKAAKDGAETSSDPGYVRETHKTHTYTRIYTYNFVIS